MLIKHGDAQPIGLILEPSDLSPQETQKSIEQVKEKIAEENKDKMEQK